MPSRGPISVTVRISSPRPASEAGFPATPRHFFGLRRGLRRAQPAVWRARPRAPLPPPFRPPPLVSAPLARRGVDLLRRRPALLGLQCREGPALQGPPPLYEVRRVQAF